MGIIRRFQDAGGTTLLTTRYMDEAERLCDRIAIIDHGHVIAKGTPLELIESLGADHVVEFSLARSVAEFANVWQALPGLESTRFQNGSIALSVRQPHQTIPALMDAVRSRGLELMSLVTRQASLEDVFVSSDRPPLARAVEMEPVAEIETSDLANRGSSFCTYWSRTWVRKTR